jgi:hypothetical protein
LLSFHADDDSIDIETMGKPAKKMKLSMDVTVEEFTKLGAELMNQDAGGSNTESSRMMDSTFPCGASHSHQCVAAPCC